MVLNDYTIRYEVVCDPYTNDCFIGCEDDECTEEYFYTEITRSASNIYALCGDDITDCEAANTCSPLENDCSVTNCDPNTEGDACDTFLEESAGQDPSSNQIQSGEIIFDNSQE